MPLAHLAGQTAGGRRTANPRFYRCALGVLEGASAHVRQAADLEDQLHHVVASIGFPGGSFGTYSHGLESSVTALKIHRCTPITI